VCKGNCDDEEARRQRELGRTTSWKNLGDIATPIEFLTHTFAVMNVLRDGSHVYSEQAFQQEKQILISLAQRTLRSTTDEERKRSAQLAMIRSLI